VLVADELTSNVQHDRVFGSLDIAPREPEEFPPTKAQRQSEHIGRFVTMASHSLKEPSRLFRLETASLAVIESRTVCDCGDIAEEDTVLLRHTQSRRRVALAILRVAGE
jgi:hypothetical protein